MLRGLGVFVAVAAAIVLYLAFAGPLSLRSATAAPPAEPPVVVDPAPPPVPAPWAPPAWAIRQQVGSNRVLVVDIEAADPENAPDIARDLVSLVGPRYEEVLMYFHRPGHYGRGELPPRRIQWTPKDGFVQMDYEAPTRR